MSARHPPSTQAEQRSKVYPTSSAPGHAMAATQIPPVGPHILPPPSTLARPGPWHPSHLSQPLFTPDPALTQPQVHGYPVQNYPTNPPPQSYHQPLTPLPRPAPQAAAPLSQLLHPAPYISAGTESSYASSYQHPDTRQYLQQPNTAHNTYSDRSAFQEYPAHEAFESSGQHLSRNEARFNPRAFPSPSQQFHRSSVGSQHSSTASSSGHGAAPPHSVPADSATQLPRNPPDITSRYRLSIRQQPIAARACGFGERDRRVIDPPIVVQVSLANFDPTSASDLAELRYPKVIQCGLKSVPWGTDVTAVSDPSNANKLSRRLMGSLVASSMVCADPDAPASSDPNARLGCFFVIHDLSCRQNGHYKLLFRLMKLDIEGLDIGGSIPILGELESDVFEVFSAKDFPGTRPSTALTKALKNQGSAVSVKKGYEGKIGQKGKKRGSGGSDDSGSEGNYPGTKDSSAAQRQKRV